ncbi:PREDICTED: zinc finger X-chromosomal protein-like [Branchiostoma belcheri]|uniref:Zinc finger X-chromosomal protein-like n=1 Tax=Branchiostoma belcheri TaxID=7741 RepID=A0A6P4YGE4_BRABE|nr:PREDICTED: zinc finger X-chromosomal protein-like [Branchiostoma belcheri]XP_019621020.1 PREDICTED: zinc finger X-chromosomal protein-like [Branchiostoma belcheri]
MADRHILGLSQEVTLAVLPRLHLEELVLELGRRNIQRDGQTDRADTQTDNMYRTELVKELSAVMMREYQGAVVKVMTETQGSSQNTTFATIENDGQKSQNTMSVTIENDGQNGQTKSVQSYSQQGVTSGVIEIETQQQTELQSVESFAGECESDNEYDPFTLENYATESSNSPKVTTVEPDSSKDDRMDVDRTQPSDDASSSLVQDIDMILKEVQHTELQAKPAECEEEMDLIPIETTCTETLDSTVDATEQLEMSEQSETQKDRISTSDKAELLEKAASFQIKTHGMEKKQKENTTCSYEQKDQVKEKRRVITKKQKQYVCDTCDYVTSSKKCLVVHIRKHTGEKPYKCSECSYAGTSSSALLKHRARHRDQEEKPYKCTQCDYAAAAKNSLQCHMGSKHGVFSFVCEVCGFRSGTVGNLNRHMATHTGVRRFKCPHCDYAAAEKKTLTSHIKAKHTENRIKPFACDKCPFTAQEKSDLTRHLKRHERKKIHQCTLCDFSSYTKCGLKTHQAEHKGGPIFSCDLCSYKTYQQHLLTRHNLVRHAGTSSSSVPIKNRPRHREEKPYKCTQCDYATAAKVSLLCHMGSKHGVFNFVCEVCGFRSATIGNLNRHAATHSDVKRFKCPHCDYAATEKKAVRRHITSKHTENRIKPFACDKCPFTAQEKSDLTRHLKRHDKKKIHKCTLCDFASHTKCGLKTHQAEHKGGPIFSCDLCSYKTYQRYLLIGHNLSRHKINMK